MNGQRVGYIKNTFLAGLNIRFDGSSKAGELLWFTDLVTRSTFVLKSGDLCNESLIRRTEEVRENFRAN
jgi:hypothetical protein